MKKRKAVLLPVHRIIGYARVSTREQTLTHQIDRLKEAGVHDDNLWVETVSGVYSRRPQRDLALMDAREGDTFLVWRIDRLDRRISKLYEIVEGLHARGIKFQSITEPLDFTTAVGKLGFGMAALWASHERNVNIERTQSGIKAARARGRPTGRLPKLSPEQWLEVEALLAKGQTPAEVAKKYKVHRQTIYTRYSSEDVARLRGEVEDEA